MIARLVALLPWALGQLGLPVPKPLVEALEAAALEVVDVLQEVPHSLVAAAEHAAAQAVGGLPLVPSLVPLLAGLLVDDFESARVLCPYRALEALQHHQAEAAGVRGVASAVETRMFVLSRHSHSNR